MADLKDAPTQAELASYRNQLKSVLQSMINGLNNAKTRISQLSTAAGGQSVLVDHLDTTQKQQLAAIRSAAKTILDTWEQLDTGDFG